MPARPASWLSVLIALLVSAGCSMFGDDEEFVDPDADSRRMYERASSSMESGNWPIAIRYFENLQAFFPFSDYSRQAQLDLMYAYYKAGMQEQAVEAADTFIRENPIHERVDYALYIKGLAYFEDEAGFLERRFNRDVTQRSPKEVS